VSAALTFSFRTRRAFGGDDSAPEDAVAAEQRFLEQVRQRVAWQAEAASRLRGGPPERVLDVLDLATLTRLVEAHADAPRGAEWRLFLDELAFLADASGRLPATLERLVRVVLADVLES
jgi:hypothetical protein